MNKSHRDIKPDLKERIDQIGEEKRKVHVKPAEKQKGSWFEEFFLERVWDFIKKAVELKVYTEVVNDSYFAVIIVNVAGRTLLDERIKLI